MTSPPDPSKIPDWVQAFLELPSFKTAVDNQVQSFKSTVDSQVESQVKDLQTAVAELKADAAEKAVEGKVFAPVPISGFKEEVAGLNAAVNGIKAEFNVFDPVKMFGLQDRYDEWLQNKFRSEEQKKKISDEKPENLLIEINKGKNRMAALEERLNKPPTIEAMRKTITANRSWAEQRFSQLTGKRNARDDFPQVRRSVPEPNLHRLEQRELQLRKTIAHFVNVVKGAVPQTAALTAEMAKIDQQLNK